MGWIFVQLPMPESPSTHGGMSATTRLWVECGAIVQLLLRSAESVAAIVHSKNREQLVCISALPTDKSRERSPFEAEPKSIAYAHAATRAQEDK